MAGRHSAPRAKSTAAASPSVKYGAIGLAAVVVVGVGAYFAVDAVAGGGCNSVTEFVVAADPEARNRRRAAQVRPIADAAPIHPLHNDLAASEPTPGE